MLHFEPDSESVYRATELSSRLMKDMRLVSEEGSSEVSRQVFSEREYDQQAYGAPIIDVITNVSQMAIEFGIIRRWDHRVLCLRHEGGEVAPIAMTGFWNSAGWPGAGPEDWPELLRHQFPPSFFRDAWRERLRRLKQEDESFIVSEVHAVEGAVERGLVSFLSYRFAGMNAPKYPPIQILRDFLLRRFGSSGRRSRGSSGGPPGVPVGGGGLHVKVSCRTPGLRLHVSPAYYINWIYFGSPTTPVTSYLLPGRYIFAGDGPMLPRRKRDSGVFSIPPTYNPQLTSF